MLQALSDKTPCTLCGGSGWEEVEGRGVRPCACKKAERMEQLLAQSRIPRNFESASFANFDADVDPATAQSLERALQISMQFVTEFPFVDVGLLYIGSCGVGKTHLSIAVLKELIAKGVWGIFYDFRDLLKEIQMSWDKETKTTAAEVLRPVYEAEVLVLDELGASKPTEWVEETITHIINKRYNDKKITIFTSNYLDVASPPDGQESLADRVGVRLKSRLDEMCRPVLVESIDYRDVIKRRRGGRFVFTRGGS